MHAHGPAGQDAGVTLANWQTDPYVRWSFQHVDQIVRTTAIPAAAPGPLPEAPVDLEDVAVPQSDGSSLPLSWVMEATETDGWAVYRHGRLIAERYYGEMDRGARHLLMSVSKSLIGMVVGVLVDGGVVDPGRPVEHYVPALAGRGYGGATVRHLLDMRSGIEFSEDYLDPSAEVRIMEQVIGWAPRTRPDLPVTLYDFLARLGRKSEHGGAFEYRSCETNMLGWVCEAATATPMTQLMSEVLWTPMGAEQDAYIGVDTAGTGMYDGGVCAALRDLVRFGALLLEGGASLGGERVLPERWLDDTWRGGEDSVAAFAASPTVTLMPGGMYRNQCWFPAPQREVLLCLGIHGQMIYVNRTSGVVAAKLSSWPEPQHAWKLFATVDAFDAVSRALAEL